MDKLITERLERIGTIESTPISGQLPLLQDYLATYHTAAWELVAVDRSGRGKMGEAPKSQQSLIKAYKAWLVRNDRAWTLASEILKQPKTEDWDFYSREIGKSPETCRQAVQALRRGGVC